MPLAGRPLPKRGCTKRRPSAGKPPLEPEACGNTNRMIKHRSKVTSQQQQYNLYVSISVALFAPPCLHLSAPLCLRILSLCPSLSHSLSPPRPPSRHLLLPPSQPPFFFTLCLSAGPDLRHETLRTGSVVPTLPCLPLPLTLFPAATQHTLTDGRKSFPRGAP